MEDYLLPLNKDERIELLHAPIYVALLGALEDGKITKREEEDAISLAHYRTFTSALILHEFSRRVDKHFKENFYVQKEALPKDVDEARKYLNEKLDNIDVILKKTDNRFSASLKKDLHSFARHVANSDRSWVEQLGLFLDPFLNLKK